MSTEGQATAAASQAVPEAVERHRIGVLLDAIAGIAICASISLAVPGTILAILGVFNPILLFLLAAAAMAAAVMLWRPDRAPVGRPLSRSGGIVMVGGLLIVAGLTLFHVSNVGHHVATDRDPGIYVNSAQWLATRGDLTIEVTEGPFQQGLDLTFSAGGVNEVPGSGTVESQFLPLPGILGAIGSWLAGLHGLVAVSPLVAGVGLFAFMMFSAQVVRPMLAVAATLALGTNLVWSYFARDSYSEPVAFALLFLGAWGLGVSSRDMNRGRAFVSGVALGSIALARIDAAVFLVGFIPILLSIWLVSVRTDAARRFVIAAVGGALAAYLLGLAALALRSRVYLDAHWNQTALLTIAFALCASSAVLISWIIPRWSELREGAHRYRRFFAVGVAVAIVVAGLFVHFVRPELDPDRTTETSTAAQYISDLQSSVGAPIDGNRTYADQSARWLGWYVGEFALAMSLLGLALLGYRVVAGRARRSEQILFFIAMAPAALYLWKPSAVPDQIWVMRRFYIAVIPVVLVCAVWLAEFILKAIGKTGIGDSARSSQMVLLSTIGVTSVFVVLVAFPLRILKPLSLMSEQAGYQHVVDGACDVLGDDGAALFFSNTNAWILWSQTIRGFCEVPVATASADMSQARIQDLADEWHRAGRVLYVFHTSEAFIAEKLPTAAVRASLSVENPFHLEPKIESRPAQLLVDRRLLLVAEVPASNQS